MLPAGAIVAVLGNHALPGSGMPLGRGGVTNPCFTTVYSQMPDCVTVIARCTSGMYGRMHKHYVRHVSLGTDGSQSVGALLMCAAPIPVLHTLCCSVALAARGEAAVCMR